MESMVIEELYKKTTLGKSQVHPIHYALYSIYNKYVCIHYTEQIKCPMSRCCVHVLSLNKCNNITCIVVLTSTLGSIKKPVSVFVFVFF